ncbi:MAG TPA: acyltransferase [Candidatus Obscuribacterales bacterium]
MTVNSSSISSKTRVKVLDVLRGVAIILVLGRHRFVSNFWYIVGWIGVDIFFVMSGFLMGNLLFKEYQKTGFINFKNFIIRRGLRIYPPFYIFILVTIIYNLIIQNSLDLNAIASEILFVQNYFPRLWSHTWYLAVDQHFSVLLLPLTLKLMITFSKNKSNPFKWIRLIFFGIALLMILLRGLTDLYIPYKNHYLQYTHLRLDSLTFGVLISYLYCFYSLDFETWIKRHKILILSISLALIFPSFILDLETSAFMHIIGVTFVYLGIGGIILFLLYWQLQVPIIIEQFSTPILDVLALIGLNSYSIYLWHLAVAEWGVDNIVKLYPHKIHYFVEFWIYCCGSIAFGIFMTKFIENPIEKLRSRWYPRKNT